MASSKHLTGPGSLAVGQPNSHGSSSLNPPSKPAQQQPPSLLPGASSSTVLDPRLDEILFLKPHFVVRELFNLISLPVSDLLDGVFELDAMNGVGWKGLC